MLDLSYFILEQTTSLELLKLLEQTGIVKVTYRDEGVEVMKKASLMEEMTNGRY